eukprot:05073_6
MYLKSSVSLRSGGDAFCAATQASNLAISAFSALGAFATGAAAPPPPAFFGPEKASISFWRELRTPTAQMKPRPRPRKISVVTPLLAFSFAAATGPEVEPKRTWPLCLAVRVPMRAALLKAFCIIFLS